MDDWVDYLFYLFVIVCSIALVGIIGFGIADWASTAEGAVVEKYYDDPDLVCSKVCTWTEECWTIIMDEQPWWNEANCVSKETYDTIEVGDYFRE